MSCENQACAGLKQPYKSRTVGEALDQQIEQARKWVEQLCIRKAKAEALNVLDHPFDFYVGLVDSPF